MSASIHKIEGVEKSQGDLRRKLLKFFQGGLSRADHLAVEVTDFHGDVWLGFRPVDPEQAEVFFEIAVTHPVQVFLLIGLLLLVHGAGRDVEEIATAILLDLERNDRVANGLVEKFRVRASRADKAYGLISPEIEREIGGRIKQATGWSVDLTQPDITIGIEVLPDRVFYTLGKEPGPGGLPTGTSGVAMCLLSGGIDSPVAAFRLMKRGCRVQFIHFHSYPILSKASQDKVREIVMLLTKHQLHSRLFMVAFGEIQRQVVLRVPPPLRVVVYRRLMLRIADHFARQQKAKAIVTGEAVGQVASQTLDNISTINAVTNLPIFRPLIGLDKEEITVEARKIETYPISIMPDQDCCQLFIPKHPSTRAKLQAVQEAENGLPIDDLVHQAVVEVVREDMTFPGHSQVTA